MNRIPSLDGLRAASIVLVVVGHLYNGFTGASPSTAFWLVIGNGSLGVTIFFVISGYLITTLLLREQERRGSISLRNFYVRRMFRILPPFYFYVGVLTVGTLIGLVGLNRGDLLSAVTFTWDYSPFAQSWMLQHTWSLSVEEQFYIFWPSILVILLKSDRTSATKLAVALILLAPILRVVTHLSGNEFLAHKIYYMLHTRMDSLMFGCLAALLEGGAVAEVAYYRLRPIATLFPVFVFVISPQLEHRLGGAYTYTMGYTLVSFSVVMMMLYAVRESEAPVGKLLNSRFVVHIGVISYSIYLWQQIFLHWAITSIFGKFPLNIVCIIATAEFSHTFVEQPFMRWRRRFEKQQLEARAMAVSA